MEASSVSKRYYCGHCEEKISKTLYFKHKKLYYDAVTKEWMKGSDPSMEIDEFDFDEPGMWNVIIIEAYLNYLDIVVEEDIVDSNALGFSDDGIDCDDDDDCDMDSDFQFEKVCYVPFFSNH